MTAPPAERRSSPLGDHRHRWQEVIDVQERGGVLVSIYVCSFPLCTEVNR